MIDRKKCTTEATLRRRGVHMGSSRLMVLLSGRTVVMVSDSVVTWGWGVRVGEEGMKREGKDEGEGEDWGDEGEGKANSWLPGMSTESS